MVDVFIQELKEALSCYDCDIVYEGKKFIVTHRFNRETKMRSWMNVLARKMECEDIGRILSSYLSPDYFFIMSKESPIIKNPYK